MTRPPGLPPPKNSLLLMMSVHDAARFWLAYRHKVSRHIIEKGHEEDSKAPGRVSVRLGRLLPALPVLFPQRRDSVKKAKWLFKEFALTGNWEDAVAALGSRRFTGSS